jgi:hypothetical protein
MRSQEQLNAPADRIIVLDEEDAGGCFARFAHCFALGLDADRVSGVSRSTADFVT